jgi:hypothetical protein
MYLKASRKVNLLPSCEEQLGAPILPGSLKKTDPAPEAERGQAGETPACFHCLESAYSTERERGAEDFRASRPIWGALPNDIRMGRVA